MIIKNHPFTFVRFCDKMILLTNIKGVVFMPTLEKTIETLTPFVISLAGKIISAVLILTVGFAIAKFAVKLLTKSK